MPSRSDQVVRSRSTRRFGHFGADEIDEGVVVPGRTALHLIALGPGASTVDERHEPTPSMPVVIDGAGNSLFSAARVSSLPAMDVLIGNFE
jgi:hypothetical protein